MFKVRNYLADSLVPVSTWMNGRFYTEVRFSSRAPPFDRVRTMPKQKHSEREPTRQREGTMTVDPVQLQADLRSSQEEARAKAVRSLCPCRSGWETFESHLDLVDRLKHDPSRLVRAQALHLYEDAREMQSEGYPTSKAQVRNEMLRTRQHSRFRPNLEERAEAPPTRQDQGRAGRRKRTGA